MAFKTTRAVEFNGKSYADQKPIAFDEDDYEARDQLLACCAIVGTGGDARGEKSLAKMTVAELRAHGEELDVEFAPSDNTKAELIAAIEKKLAEPEDAGE